ncbi:hypothetical protein NDU88_006747 [Pleurodeles waltl]|uniref:Uncharacterized protein n=1 Tax=Pleurodeles waltl TaxID=8319 RepID=A0AAV7TZE8_PLEWA|nr:hypothetical protein NDU88_006747 [Pleurodeles waltl]
MQTRIDFSVVPTLQCGSGVKPAAVVGFRLATALFSKAVERKKVAGEVVRGDYAVGDMVRVVKAGKNAKGESKFSEPLEVIKLYKYSLLLSDGNVWNGGKIVKVPVCVGRENVSDVDTKSGVAKSLTNRSDYSRVSVRDKSLLKLPKKFEDFVVR